MHVLVLPVNVVAKAALDIIMHVLVRLVLGGAYEDTF